MTNEAKNETLLFWDFENAMSERGISIAVGISSMPRVISGFASQTGGGPAEHWGETGLVFLTRFLGTNDAFLWITVTEPMFVEGLTFRHWHNHNPGFPTHPTYQVQLQIDTGTGYRSVGKPLKLSNENSGATDTMLVGKSLKSGNYKFRWLPKGLKAGRDTNTEFFALKNLKVTGHVVASE